MNMMIGGKKRIVLTFSHLMRLSVASGNTFKVEF